MNRIINTRGEKGQEWTGLARVRVEECGMAGAVAKRKRAWRGVDGKKNRIDWKIEYEKKETYKPCIEKTISPIW